MDWRTLWESSTSNVHAFQTVLNNIIYSHFAPFVFTKTLYPLLLETSKQPESDVRVVIVGISILSPPSALLCVFKVSSTIHSRAPAAGKFATLDEINDPLAPPSSQDGIIARYARYGQRRFHCCS